MKKIITIFGILILLNGISCTPALSIKNLEKINKDIIINSSITITVDDEGDGDYTYIQDAINNSNPGDLIQVYSGIYNEIIKIDVEDLMIEGIPYDLGSGGDFGKPQIYGGLEGSVVNIVADNIELKEFLIFGSGLCYLDAGINIGSDNNTISNNMIIRNHHGIFLNFCSENKITGNTINWNNWDGIYMLDFCSNNVIENNIINSNNVDGIKIYFANNTGNKILNNEINSNRWNGVHIMLAVNNHILNNNISSNFLNGLHLGKAKDNIIRLNFITSNFLFGVFLFDKCSGNQIYHNNIINNFCHDEGNNIWDNGYPGGGNFWCDYTGNDTDGDGIGDTPYDIPGGENKDNFPFVEPILPPFKPTRPIGKVRGKAGEEYSYKTWSIDPNFDMMQYGWDWDGDKKVDEWTDFYNSGETCTAYHIWSEDGSYTVYVIAMDEFGAQSEWSEPLHVSMPDSKNVIKSLYSRVFEKLFIHFPIITSFIDS